MCICVSRARARACVFVSNPIAERSQHFKYPSSFAAIVPVTELLPCDARAHFVSASIVRRSIDVRRSYIDKTLQRDGELEQSSKRPTDDFRTESSSRAITRRHRPILQVRHKLSAAAAAAMMHRRANARALVHARASLSKAIRTPHACST